MRWPEAVERGVVADSGDWRKRHYHFRGDEVYECKYCTKRYKGQRNRGWMLEHLRRKHWDRNPS